MATQFDLGLDLPTAELDRRLRRSDDLMLKLGRSTDRVQKAFDRLRGRGQKAARDVGGATKRLNTSLGRSTAIVGGLNSNLLKLGAAALVAHRAFRLLSGSVEQFAILQTDLIGVAKTTDLTGDALSAFGRDVTALSTGPLPVARTLLLEIAEASGQVGVEGANNLLKYVDTFAKLGAATDVQGGQAVKDLTRLQIVQGETSDVIDRTASVLVRLGNATAASESEIISHTSEVGRATSQFKIGSVAALGFGAALVEIGSRAEGGGTAIGKAFRGIQKAIGEGGKELQAFADLAGVSAERFAETFDTSPVEGFNLFLKGLSRFGRDSAGALATVGLETDRVAKVLPVLAENLSILQKNQALAADEAARMTALNTEAAAAFGTLASQLQGTRNLLTDVSSGFGEGLVPAVTDANETLRTFLTENREAFITFGIVVGGILQGLAGAFELLFKPVLIVARAGRDELRGLGAEMQNQINQMTASSAGLASELDNVSAAIAAGPDAILAKLAQTESALARATADRDRALEDSRQVFQEHGAAVEAAAEKLRDFGVSEDKLAKAAAAAVDRTRVFSQGLEKFATVADRARGKTELFQAEVRALRRIQEALRDALGKTSEGLDDVADGLDKLPPPVDKWILKLSEAIKTQETLLGIMQRFSVSARVAATAAKALADGSKAAVPTLVDLAEKLETATEKARAFATAFESAEERIRDLQSDIASARLSIEIPVEFAPLEFDPAVLLPGFEELNEVTREREDILLRIGTQLQKEAIISERIKAIIADTALSERERLALLREAFASIAAAGAGGAGGIGGLLAQGIQRIRDAFAVGEASALDLAAGTATASAGLVELGLEMGFVSEESARTAAMLADLGRTIGAAFSEIGGEIGAATGTFLALAGIELGRTGQAVAQGAAAGAQAGGMVGGPVGAGIGLAVGAAVGFALDALSSIDQTFANGSTEGGRLAGQILEGSGELAAQTEQILNSITDTVNGILDLIGGEFSTFTTFAVQIRETEEGIKIWVDGQLRSFGEDVAAALDFAVTEIFRRAEVSGVSDVVSGALNSFVGSTVEELGSTLADALTIENLGLPQIAQQLGSELSELGRLLERSLFEFGAGAENVLLGPGGIVATSQRAFDQAFGIERDQEELTRQNIAAVQAQIAIGRAQLLILRQQLTAQRSEVQGRAAGVRAQNAATEALLISSELATRGLAGFSGAIAVTGAVASGAAEQMVDALAAIDEAIAALDALDFSPEAIDRAVRRQSRGGGGRGPSEAERGRARLDLEMAEALAAGNEALAMRLEMEFNQEQQIARINLLLGEEAALRFRLALEQQALNQEMVEYFELLRQLQTNIDGAAASAQRSIDNLQQMVGGGVSQFARFTDTVNRWNAGMMEAQAEIDNLREEIAALGAESPEAAAGLNVIARIMSEQLETVAAGAADFFLAQGASFLQSLSSLGVSLPTELVLELAQAQFALAQAEATAAALALFAAGAFDTLSITLDELLDLIAGATFEASQFAPQAPRAITPGAAGARGIAQEIDSEAVLGRINDAIEAWDRLALGSVTRQALGLTDQLEELQAAARAAGLPLDRLNAGFRRRADLFIEDRLAQGERIGEGPFERRIREINAEFDDLAAAFEVLGASSNQLRRLELQRLAEVAQAQEDAREPLRDFLAELRGEDPRRTGAQTFRGAESRFRELAARVRGGDLGAAGELVAAGRALREQSRIFQGQGIGSFRTFSEIERTIAELAGEGLDAKAIADPVVAQVSQSNIFLRDIRDALVGDTRPRGLPPVTVPPTTGPFAAPIVAPGFMAPVPADRAQDREFIQGVVREMRRAEEEKKRERDADRQAAQNRVSAEMMQREAQLAEARRTTEELAELRADTGRSPRLAGGLGSVSGRN
jgi:TP901 family phage tail tape measure protein